MEITGMRDSARQYFKDCGLTYQDITVWDLRRLELLLNQKFIEAALSGNEGRPIYWKRVNDAKNYKGQYDDEGKMICAFLTAKGTYFNAREVISFNRDGFIGFCGDSDKINTKPVVTAFREWCDWLKEGRK